VENGLFGERFSGLTFLNARRKIMKLRWQPRDKIPAVTVVVVGAPSSGIELVLSKNSLPVAQIRVFMQKWTTSKMRAF
jgi:hypothetical protein